MKMFNNFTAGITGLALFLGSVALNAAPLPADWRHDQSFTVPAADLTHCSPTAPTTPTATATNSLDAGSNRSSLAAKHRTVPAWADTAGSSNAPSPGSTG